MACTELVFHPCIRASGRSKCTMGMEGCALTTLRDAPPVECMSIHPKKAQWKDVQ